MSRLVPRRSLILKLQVTVASALLTFASLPLTAWFARIAGASPAPLECSHNARVKGNPCGDTKSCTDTNCVSWFTAAGGDFFKCTAGLPTDNCLSSTAEEDLVTCGSGGQCDAKVNGVCQPLAGTTKYTPKVSDGPACYVKSP